ncbi:hypothetical protein HRI_005135700 [Hibiscus trionum]|uniref:Dof zinc finger protein n=1 Tax=Hibiscus trionum TaxID=183268 RepID=A0A9W7MWE3_HIBTR|nr:hypothetical protein HRI_005135700 [Hibiscus trionum]
MGLSSKQVSSDGIGWNQGQSLSQAAPTTELSKASSMKRRHQLNQQPESEPPLKCPRCDSPNTKFCYYNNYNKSQPRYYCKTCKRHWTKGGTLRNVPVGGGRKNKRIKTSTAATAATKSSTTTSCLNSRLNDQVRPSYSSEISEIFSTSNGVFLGSTTMSQGLQFPFSSSSSSSLEKSTSDPTIVMPGVMSGIEMANCYWDWDDIDELVSTDLNIPWDDSQIIP